jgi:hypothetical protein
VNDPQYEYDDDRLSPRACCLWCLLGGLIWVGAFGAAAYAVSRLVR